MMKATKQQLIEALRAFINQRSGIDFRNYQSGNYEASRKCFMGDYRPIIRHGRHARQMLQAVAWRDSITAKHLIDATRAFSGRLQFKENGNGVSVEYGECQDFANEYRKAACAVLKQCLWDYWSSNMSINEISNCPPYYPNQDGIVNIGKYILRKARNELGRGIAKEWFS